MSEKGDTLFKFTQTRLAQYTEQGAVFPEHEFFELCEKLLGFYDVFESTLIENGLKDEVKKMKEQ